MPADDRERSFENALASHLRADGSAGAQDNACADADVLAAYHEGSLEPDQIASLKTHLTTCTRCQEILALLGATDEIPIAATKTAPAGTAGPKANVRVLPPHRPTVWRWVAPAGALAAALLVWVAVRENNPLSLPSKKPTLDANRMEPAQDLRLPPASIAPPPDSALRGKASSDSLQPLSVQPQSKVARRANELPQGLLKQKDLSSAATKSAASENFDKLADSSLDARLTADPGISAEVTKNQLLKSDAKSDSKEKSASSESRVRQDARSAASLQPALEPQRNAVATVAPAAPPAPVAGAAVGGVLAESAPATGRMTQQQEIEGISLYKRKAEMRLANSIAEVTVSAPGGQDSWRAGQAGVIEFSVDAGKTWTLQPSGVVTDLLAGSATSDKICWIVGRAGTILRTTDGGAHWQKIRPPTQDDFRAVFAVDGRQATVSADSGKYQTTDGGSTWHKLPTQ
jgi:hypothetical protein